MNLTASPGQWFTVALIAAHAPLVLRYLAGLWTVPHYSFFPFVLAGATALAWRDRPAEPLYAGRGATLAGMLTATMTMLILAILLHSAWLGIVAALLSLGAWMYGRGGPQLFRTMLPAWLFLWLLVRLPLNLDDRLIRELQAITARRVGQLLDLFGVEHVMNGNVVEIAGRQLLVEEACSGIQSLFSVLVCTAFYLLWLRRPWLRSLLVLASIPVWVLVGNVARVFLVTVLCTWGWAADQGFAHSVLGGLAFLTVLGLTLSTDRLLLMFLLSRSKFRSRSSKSPIPQSPDAAASFTTPLPLESRWVRVLFASAFGLVFLAQLPAVLSPSAVDRRPEAVETMLVDVGESTLPETIGPWRRVKYEAIRRDRGSEYGANSHTWVYEAPSRTAVVSLDFPFTDWHDLTICYRAQGWQVTVEDPDGDQPGTLVAAALHRPTRLQYAALLFDLYNQNGKQVAPAVRGDAWELVMLRLGQLRNLVGADSVDSASGPTSGAPTYQLQVLVESALPITGADRQDAAELFEALRQRCSGGRLNARTGDAP